MTENHEYNLYITDLPDETPTNGQPVKHIKNLDEIFDKDPKAVIQIIWPDNKKTKDRSSEF